MVLTLYRPVGQLELDLIEASGWRRFPPRLDWQPIFYPVLNEAYATRIAREWNTKDSENGNVGYVLKFDVDSVYVGRFDTQQVGDEQCLEYWVPAEDLEEFNNHIAGLVQVVSVWRLQNPDLTETQRVNRRILDVLVSVEPLMQAAFAEVGGTPIPDSTLDQMFLLDGRLVVEDYLEHNEAGLAVEHLMYMIDALPSPLSKPALDMLGQVYRQMSMPEEKWTTFLAGLNH